MLRLPDRPAKYRTTIQNPYHPLCLQSTLLPPNPALCATPIGGALDFEHGRVDGQPLSAIAVDQLSISAVLSLASRSLVSGSSLRFSCRLPGAAQLIHSSVFSFCPYKVYELSHERVWRPVSLDLQLVLDPQRMAEHTIHQTWPNRGTNLQQHPSVHIKAFSCS